MKRPVIAAIGAAGLAAVFLLAAVIYQRQQAAEIEGAGARYGAAPYVREHSPALGPEDARVVLVEFFDPG